MSAKKWPRFVWRVVPNRDNLVSPELWAYSMSSGTSGENGAIIEQPTAAQYDIFPGEETLSLEELARRYPPPQGREWRKLPGINVDINKPLNAAIEGSKSEA